LILGKIGPACLPALTPSLTSTNPVERALAAATVGMIGPEARSMIPTLQGLLHDASNMVRLSAADALIKIGADPIPLISILLECLQPSDSDNRSYAFELLGKLKEKAKSAVPYLTNTIANATNADDRFMVLDALRKIDPKTASRFEVK
jgi:HEAT repeat protein